MLSLGYGVLISVQRIEYGVLHCHLAVKLLALFSYLAWNVGCVWLISLLEACYSVGYGRLV